MEADLVRSGKPSAVIPGARANFTFTSDSVYVEILSRYSSADPSQQLPGAAVVLPLAGLPSVPLTVGSLFAGRPSGSVGKDRPIRAFPGPVDDFANAANQLNGVYSASNQTVADLLNGADHQRLLAVAADGGPFEVRFLPGSMTFRQAFDDVDPLPAANAREALREIVELLAAPFRSSLNLQASHEYHTAHAVYRPVKFAPPLATTDSRRTMPNTQPQTAPQTTRPQTAGREMIEGQPVLLVIDIQGGEGAQVDSEETSIPLMDGYDERLASAPDLITKARQCSVPIIFFQEAHRHNLIDFARELDGVEGVHLLEDDPGTAVDPALGMRDDDYFIRKRRYSCFFGTELEILLKGLKADTLILIGGHTDVCVHYTFVDAHQHDYFCRVVEDCVAGSSLDAHDGALRAMEYLQTGARRTTAEIMAGFEDFASSKE